MNVKTQSREYKKIVQLARDYSDQGYKVLANISGYDSPDLIGNWEPDIIILKDENIIIIEVTTSESRKENKEKIKYLAEYAKSHKNIQFDLVVTNPRPKSSNKNRLKTLEEEFSFLEKSLLNNLEETVRSNRIEIAIVLAYHLLEKLLLQAAAKKDAKSEFTSYSMLDYAHNLYNLEIISFSV